MPLTMGRALHSKLLRRKTMKKILFLLAAFASMAVACQVEDVNEAQTPAGETFTIEAAIVPSTKTSLTITEDAYKVEWDAEDALSVVAKSGDSYAGYEFKNAGDNIFSGTVSEPANISEIYVIYPYDDHLTSINTQFGTLNGYVTVGSKSTASQTQEGVDNSNHIKGNLYGQAMVENGTASVEMKHATTLFEIIIANNSGADIEVTNIKLSNSADRYMIGDFYVSPETGLSTASNASSTASLIVVNGAILSGQTGKFYITTAPFELSAGDELTVTVTMDDGTNSIITKTLESDVQFEAGKVNHINAPVEQIEAIEYIPVSELLETVASGAVNVEGVVAAINSRSYILVDENTPSAYILAYKNAEPSEVKIGDKVQISGGMSSYNGLPQITHPVVDAVVSNSAVSYPDPVVLNGEDADALIASPERKFIQFTGTLNISGSYYNVTIEGASKAVGSVTYPAEDLTAYNGKLVTVTGYFNGVSSSKYLNILITSVVAAPYCNVTPGALSAGSEAGTTEFMISSNESWTVTSNNEAYTVSPASGDGDASVTVTYPKNSLETSVEVIFTISGEFGEKTVTLLQSASGASAEPVVLIDEDFSSADSGNNTSTNSGNTQWSNDNFPDCVKTYEAGTAIKIGASGDPGSITSKTISVPAGSILTVSFDVKGWTKKEGDIEVTFNGETKTVQYTALLSDNFENQSATFKVDSEVNSTVKIATTDKRAFIDNVKISYIK